MADLLLILFAFALLFVTYVVRTLLALRLPVALVYKPTKINQPPDIMADLFSQTDRTLSGLGFNYSHWATVHTTPPLPGFTAPLIRIYHHKTQPIVARVAPPHSIFSTDECQVVFLSRSDGKTFLATANRYPELFPRPPENHSIMLNTNVDTLAEQFRAHTMEMAQRGLQWLDRSTEKGESAWSFHLLNRYERKSVEWVLGQGFVKQLPDGSGIPTFGTVLRFIGRLVTGRVRSPPAEKSAIPANRAAYLFQNWQRTFQLSPPLSAQLGLFLASTLAFMLLAGPLWGWLFSLLLLGVIVFHEAGHWLAMRSLGYRNLQILMLPLIGGVTMGRESSANAAHRTLISLMGPLPGILLGTVLLSLFGMQGGWLTDLGIILLAVNYLNLLPVLPLDGGQVLKALIPNRQFGLLIGLEWAGCLALLLLAWLADSLILAGLALLPLFGGLGLLRRKRVLAELEDQSPATDLPPAEQIASIVRAMDKTGKSYRPLVRKAQEIEEILTGQRLTPAAPRMAGILLAVYLGAFLLPPVAAFVSFPSLQAVTGELLYGYEEEGRKAYARALGLPISQLVRELAAGTRRLVREGRPELDRKILRQPASAAAIAQAEQRLGIRLDGEYRQFLETSDGLSHILNGGDEPGYLLFPIERVERFKRRLPRLLARLGGDGGSGQQPVIVYRYLEFSDEGQSEEVLDPARLAEMLVIGSRHEGEYLLLDPRPRNDAASSVILANDTLSGFSGRRFESLRDYLANDLALIRMAMPD